MILSFVVCDKDGRPSTAKIWRHIAFGVITYKVSFMTDITVEMLLAYAAIVGGIELGQKYMESKNRGVAGDDK